MEVAMNEDEAGEIFDALFVRASGHELPATPESAIAFLDEAGLEPLEGQAVTYYVSEGTSVPHLAETLMQAATMALVAAILAAGLADRPGSRHEGTLRRVFQDLMVSLAPSLDATSPPTRARQLIGTLHSRLGIGKAMLQRADIDSVNAWMASRDLLEAAGVGYLLAQLVGDPAKTS
jgi:hypothetical protein